MLIQFNFFLPVQFFLTSSDTTGGFGMNTPNFFCIDDFNGVAPNGIEDTKLVQALDIYPNPAIDRLLVKTSHSNSVISIIDISGKVVFNTTLKVIDISHLNKGVYFVREESNAGILTNKFIKQ
jgi:hypothetical protein